MMVRTKNSTCAEVNSPEEEETMNSQKRTIWTTFLLIISTSIKRSSSSTLEDLPMVRSNQSQAMTTRKCPPLEKAKSRARKTKKDTFTNLLKILKNKWQNREFLMIALKLKDF